MRLLSRHASLLLVRSGLLGINSGFLDEGEIIRRFRGLHTARRRLTQFGLVLTAACLGAPTSGRSASSKGGAELPSSDLVPAPVARQLTGQGQRNPPGFLDPTSQRRTFTGGSSMRATYDVSSIRQENLSDTCYDRCTTQ